MASLPRAGRGLGPGCACTPPPPAAVARALARGARGGWSALLRSAGLFSALSCTALAEETVYTNEVTHTDEPLRVALLVGLDGGIGSSGNLTAAERGVTDLAQALHSEGFSHITVLTGGDVTTEQVLKTLAQYESLRPETAVAYVATHGATCPIRDRKSVIHHLRTTETLSLIHI